MDEDNRWLRRVAWLVAIALILFLIWWLWPPMANPDHATVASGEGGRAINVLSNDRDLFGRPIYIKSWSNGTNGGRVALAGNKLVYSAPTDHSVKFDIFSYTIWTGHGFPSSASVAVTINANGEEMLAKNTPRPKPATLAGSQGLVPTPAIDCPRGEAHTTAALTPLPKQYGNCFAIYFAWDDANLFADHAHAVKAMLALIAKRAVGKAVLIDGYTDTSGIHYTELSRARACAVAQALGAGGLGSAKLAYAVGTADPAVTTETEVRERLNRRVEIRIVPDGSAPTTDLVQCEHRA